LPGISAKEPQDPQFSLKFNEEHSGNDRLSRACAKAARRWIVNLSKAPANLLDAVAIIGMAGRFPGARSVAEFWRNQLNGVESISHFRVEDLEVPDAGELAKRPNYVRSRSILEDVDLFDADFFGIYPREAELMDPQHRLMLEVAWESLEHAGIPPHSLAGSDASVYVGYADNLRASPFFPIGFGLNDSLGTISPGGITQVFTGGGTFDSGAILIVNTGASSFTLDSLSATVPTWTNAAPPSRTESTNAGDIWAAFGNITLMPGNGAIFTQTGSFNFDTSDFGSGGLAP